MSQKGRLLLGHFYKKGGKKMTIENLEKELKVFMEKNYSY